MTKMHFKTLVILICLVKHGITSNLREDPDTTSINDYSNNVQKNNNVKAEESNIEPDMSESKANDNLEVETKPPDDYISDNSTEEIQEEECVGMVQYCNLTEEEYTEMILNYVYPKSHEWVLIATHSLVFVIGLVGNALVCIAVYQNRSMRTVTNYFIVNLAVADFMVILFCLPPTVAWDVTETWFLGDGLCKVLLYFQSVSVTVSVLTLTFISLDRWYAICFPLRSQSTTKRAKSAILVIWVFSLCFNIPELIVLKTMIMVPLRFNLKFLTQCVADWSDQSDLVWHIIKIVFIYTLPLLLMTVAYYKIVRVLWRSQVIPGKAETGNFTSAEFTQLRSRRKASKMLVVVVIMFAVCYFPVHLLSVLKVVFNMQQTEVISCLSLISHVLCYANSAINPLIYNFMSGKFRAEFRRTFCCVTNKREVTTITNGSSRLHNTHKSYDMVTYDTKCAGHGHYNLCSTTVFDGKNDRFST